MTVTAMKRRDLLTLPLGGAFVAAAASRTVRAAPLWAPAEGARLLGTPAPRWQGLRWLHGGPLELRGLRGRPVLVRFWTNGCRFCHGSAPVLSDLWAAYRGRGLMVVGIHHPKGPGSLAEIAAAAKELGFTFPVATDPDWTTVRAYGVGTTFQRYTSISVLIDGCGVIRFVHDGGTIASDSPEHRALVAAVEAALGDRSCSRRAQAANADADVGAALGARAARRSGPG